MAAEGTNEEDIFRQALQLESREEQKDYIRRACGEDMVAYAAVEALLLQHYASSILDAPALESLFPPQTTSLTEAPGTVIGRYKLLEKIGEGGMAVVYMAEQTEPIRRKVALKIIKLGMDTRQVTARFEAERQALALMDHPNIAKVLDAGATEAGRPYFVMELVQGVSITEYCDKNSLSAKDRLALFLQVCQAVQHAHQKGIIHRDIKPSNVMVTHHDGKPVPKVIDFGIAKATNQKLTEKTLFTRYAHLIGTPAYMSPEQAELSDLDIDTRSDIYSLGVLLYELLTGTTPFSEEELRKAGYLEMQRVIREQEPVKPSTKLSTLGETLTDIAKCRNCTPDLLRKTIRGDLDWIVMKSLEKDRARRYETASGLAEDIRRHLEHEPVLARGPGTAYRLRKFLRRHRVPLLIGSTVGVLLAVVAVGLSVWNQDRLQWKRDRLQLAEADKLRHQALLSQVQGQYASGERDAALGTIQPILDSPHVGGKAQLLRANILVDNRCFDEATAILKTLLDGPREIAGAAHVLMVRVLRENGDLDAQKLQEIEEHRQKAATLLPETAEGHFLQAMTALTVEEQLTALDQALELDPKHYEACRLRAFTYYASRKYERMNEDAVVLKTLRDRDPLGYSLRATALQELGRYQEALAEYGKAISLTPGGSSQHLDLATQRCETLLRKGDYAGVLAEAERCLRLWPERLVFRYHRFCALTASGEYNQAAVVFQEIVQATPTARNEFRSWATKYVFDTLEAGQSWHQGGPVPTEAAFLPLVEAEDNYQGLSRKARRIFADGLSAQWSPDGKRLVLSIGVHGFSGVAIYDPATGKTELLIVPGQQPRWSPDGRHIAFVRHSQALELGALATPGTADQMLWPQDEEVWIMNADGTQARRLARGGWPCWSRDSTCVYYQSRLDRTLCAISIKNRDAQPQRLMACPSLYPSVSPEGQRVAYLEGTSLRVLDIGSRGVIAEWPVPASAWGGPAWSPAGDELCLAGIGGGESRTGLWIYRFDRKEPARVLDGQITLASWAPDGTKLVFGLGASSGIWTAGLEPHASVLASLGPGRTLDEHFQEMMTLCTRRIEIDPLDAYAYSCRAAYYDSLRQRTEANADLRRWSALVNQGVSSDFRLDTPWTLVRSANAPWGYQIVVFAERRENGLHVLRIACGQKGRCKMKTFEVPMVLASLMGMYLLPGLGTPLAHANFTFGRPTNLGPPISTSGNDYFFVISRDGLEAYCSSDDGLSVVRRATADSAWGPRTLLLNGAGPSCLSADELSLYLTWGASGETGLPDVWMMTRAAKSDNWGPPVNLGPTVNTASWWDWGGSLSADGLELYFASNRPGGYGSQDLYAAKRTSPNAPWGTPANLGPIVNSPAWDESPAVSPDGLVLFFSSQRAGGYGGSGDIYMTHRATTKDPWGPPANLGAIVNSASGENNPTISPDGSMLYFGSDRSGGVGGFDFWQAPILPILDFNGDGKVDEKDLAMLIKDWHVSNWMSACDIGPYAWGDGVVDEKDLKVFMEAVVQPAPKASDVPCDVSLRWISPGSTPTCDVYFGTAAALVGAASRVTPLSVLVSQGQTTTTYTPTGLLEFSRTYYWRVDFVIPGPAPVIYRGPVFEFTTAASVYWIKNLTATASSAQAGSGPERTVDSSGLDTSDGHSTDVKDMWWSQGVAPNWVQYEFDKVYALHEMWVWNMNQIIEPFIGFGAKTVRIEYSIDGATWTPLTNVPEFARGTGQDGYVHNTVVSFGGVSAKYVKLTVEKNWSSSAPQTGLSEVRFFATQAAVVTKP